MVLADGAVVEVSQTVQPALFRAAIGGYGALAVITEVELEVADNLRIERVVEKVSLQHYVWHFKDKALADKRADLHIADLNAGLDLFVRCLSFAVLHQDASICVVGRDGVQATPSRVMPRPT